jgi:hypothetical protein
MRLVGLDILEELLFVLLGFLLHLLSSGVCLLEVALENSRVEPWTFRNVIHIEVSAFLGGAYPALASNIRHGAPCRKSLPIRRSLALRFDAS